MPFLTKSCSDDHKALMSGINSATKKLIGETISFFFLSPLWVILQATQSKRVNLQPRRPQFLLFLLLHYFPWTPSGGGYVLSNTRKARLHARFAIERINQATSRLWLHSSHYFELVVHKTANQASHFIVHYSPWRKHSSELRYRS